MAELISPPMRRPGGRLAAFIAVALAAAPGVRADAGWYESGDGLLRSDLTLLNDAQIIHLPVNQWPMPRAAVRYALANARETFAVNAAVIAALERVRARTAEKRDPAFSATGRAGEPGLLRDFDTLAREEGELTAAFEAGGDRVSLTARATVVTTPADGQRLRVDGSAATLRLGNWLVSANTLDRFWGPAHDSSLILSNNARPMPTFMIERAEAREFESPWLSWIGPWRFSLGVSRMETERVDVDSPLFMAWRVTIMPWRKFELGFTRTAQFCGEQLACDLSSITEMLIGNDNVGIDASEANEPGNQMAGFDIRWSSPIGNAPYAVYSQMIGEDESSFLPVKYLAQFGVEMWRPLGDGGLVQGFAEYVDSTCSANRSNPRFNCAYNQLRFSAEGYRYRGRVIGHTIDRDSEGVTVGVKYTDARGAFWSVTGRSFRLNRDDNFDEFNSAAQVGTRFQSLELGWRGKFLGGDAAVEVGTQSLETDTTERDVEPFGFLSWTYAFGE
jgi:hypothetical protein